MAYERSLFLRTYLETWFQRTDGNSVWEYKIIYLMATAAFYAQIYKSGQH